MSRQRTTISVRNIDQDEDNHAATDATHATDGDNHANISIADNYQLLLKQNPALARLKNVIPFVVKTYAFVSDPSIDEYISWNKLGDAFTIHKPVEFIEKIGSNFFRHKNFLSFIRMLNIYGFRKSDPNSYTFIHPDFLRGRPGVFLKIEDDEHPLYLILPHTTDYTELLPNIKNLEPKNRQKKKLAGGSSALGTGAVVEAGAWGDMENDVDRLKRDKEALHSEIVKLRQQYDQQNHVLKMVLGELHSTREQHYKLSQTVQHIYGLLFQAGGGQSGKRKRTLESLEDFVSTTNTSLPPLLTYDVGNSDAMTDEPIEASSANGAASGSVEAGSRPVPYLPTQTLEADTDTDTLAARTDRLHINVNGEGGIYPLQSLPPLPLVNANVNVAANANVAAEKEKEKERAKERERQRDNENETRELPKIGNFDISDTQDNLLGIDSMLRDILPQYGFAEREGVDDDSTSSTQVQTQAELTVPTVPTVLRENDDYEYGYFEPEARERAKGKGKGKGKGKESESDDDEDFWSELGTLLMDEKGHIMRD